MGLGGLDSVTLAEARVLAARCRSLRHSGVDPIDARKSERSRARSAAAGAVSFRACAELYIAAHRAGWGNRKHASQWDATIRTYVDPVLGNLPIAQIDTGAVLQVVEPIWAKKPETAKRLRGRIERILDWATTRGYRHGENPARWRGHLQNLLPSHSKLHRVQHHRALDYNNLPGFMVSLRAREGIAARALEFAILTAARTGEVLGTTHSEIDRRTGIWIIPAKRMKGGREHRIPLSDAARALLDALPIDAGAEHVFPGQRRGKSLSNMAMLNVLHRMGYGEVTTHGFRSAFRDWAAERTDHVRDVVEMALAHAISNKVEAAYRRGDLFEKRRSLMNDWAAFCDSAA